METFLPYLAVTIVAGLIVVALRLPPLVGFLAAGFVLAALGIAPFPGLDEIADLGVTLLLFTIGLKFDARTLLRPEVWSAGILHIAVATVAGAAALWGIAAVVGSAVAPGDLGTFAIIGLALSFSSTVVCIKVLEERSDDGSIYGQTAIGILVIQDLAAVAFMTVAHGEPPSPWALALVGILPLSWLIRRVWDRIDHPELIVLFGIAVALIPGYFAFEAVHLKGDLGALLMGILLASHPRSGKLAKSLFGVKELFLVGFFVSIGAAGLPTLADLGVAAALVIVLTPVQIVLYALLLRLFRVRNRTAVLGAILLGNFSEFAIIVADVGADGGFLDAKWLAILSLAVAMSFIVATFLNRPDLRLVDWIVARLPEQDPAKLSPRDRIVDVGRANAIVLGMGRIGRAAYDRLAEEYGWRVVGIDNNHARVEELRAEGYRVLEGDGSDAEFWTRIRSANSVEMALLAMPHHYSNETAFDHLARSGFEGRTAVVVQRDEDAAAMRGKGADDVLHLYEGAGIELADQAVGSVRHARDIADPTPDDAPLAPTSDELEHGARAGAALSDGAMRIADADRGAAPRSPEAAPASRGEPHDADRRDGRAAIDDGALEAEIARADDPER